MGKILNKRSNVVENGKAKLPTPSQLDYGEIAINFAAGKETISIKNSNDEIVTFPTNSQLEEIEFVTANALNEHEFALNQFDNALRQIYDEFATSANTYNAIINASGDIKSYVDNKVSSVYTYKGSVTNYSDLASITTKEVGDVYNVVNANGSTPGGTNYAWTGSEWDALGGTIDLSNYVENSSFTAHTASTTVHVSSSEKSIWNGKQDAISDLSTIRTNAENGANAYQNMITGVTINGSAATVTNKNASINIETGGSGLPSVTSSDNGKILQVVNGQWELVTPSTIYTGQEAPDNLLGIDGDIYLQTS